VSETKEKKRNEQKVNAATGKVEKLERCCACLQPAVKNVGEICRDCKHASVLLH